ncbi:MAG: hypothetical protein FWF96_06480 [Kiritimatiellaeota bacterium]|nr:hypothetical protein [Kiritimatiellota bacterium]
MPDLFESLPLDGRWLLRWNDFQRGQESHVFRDPAAIPGRWLDADVPGEIHLDLVRHGLIEEPNTGLNVLSCRWVEETQWNYRRDFDAPAAALAPGGRAWLVFERLDLAAKVVLNGQQIARHQNSFLPLRVDVTGKLREGANQLVVVVESGLFATRDKPSAGYSGSDDQQLAKRVWQRKPQCQFGWDWSPRLLNVGVTGSVRLEWTGAPARFDRLVPLATVSDDLAKGCVRVRAFVENFSGKPLPVTLDTTLAPEGGAVCAQAKGTFEAKPGLHPVEVELRLDAPALWWPVGQGAQPLYEVRATIAVDGQALPARQAAVGFPPVRINQEPPPETGRYFIVEINNRKVFLKGGNFVPADLVTARTDRARCETLVSRALEANFNCLRIWGGGLYESDEFYETCDRAGVLVWQEFIFACAKYPAHDLEFHTSVMAEATHQVRRLAQHPSLFVWCGNNEKEMGEWDWKYMDETPVHPDWSLFHFDLPRMMKREDPTRFYWPSSPYSHDFENPNADHTGDQHPWSLGFFDTDYRKYRAMICRFPNEGGCLGATSLPTTLACLPEGPQRKLYSFAWHHHDNSIALWAGEPSAVDLQLNTYFGVTPDANLAIEDWVYWGGLVQAEAYKDYIESFRGKMFDSASAIFWMYNDTWPATRSWTIVDYYLRRTPSFWSVRRANAPVHVILAENADGGATVWGVNDTPAAFSGTVRFGVFGLSGGYGMDESAKVTLAPGARTKLGVVSAAAWADPARNGTFAWLSDAAGKEVARTHLFRLLPNEMKGWQKPDVSVRLENGEAVFTSKAFTLGVCIDLDGETPLTDNFFDLFPGREHRIPWTSKTPPKIFTPTRKGLQ